jgi:hypothetical protein
MCVCVCMLDVRCVCVQCIVCTFIRVAAGLEPLPSAESVHTATQRFRTARHSACGEVCTKWELYIRGQQTRHQRIARLGERADVAL